MGTCDDNDTMLQRSDQLLLTPENDQFEGSMHLKAKEGTNTRLGGEGRGHFSKKTQFKEAGQVYSTKDAIFLLYFEEFFINTPIF